MSKNILIVGGSSGLGRQLAELYAGEDCKVGILARRENLLIEIQQHFSENIFIKKANIADDSINMALHELIADMGGIDIIIVAASVINFNTDLNPGLEKETIAINVKGYTNVLTTAWNYFKEKGGGQIAGITSIAAARGNKVAPAYHASKSFQSVYLESLRIKSKFEKNNIAITELIPGYIDTDMGKGDRMFWTASLTKAGKQAKKAIDTKKQRVFISKRWWFVYHLQRFFPIFIYDSVVNGSWKLKRKK